MDLLSSEHIMDFITSIFETYGLVGLLACALAFVLYYYIKHLLDSKEDKTIEAIANTNEKTIEAINNMNSNLVNVLGETLKTVIETHDANKKEEHYEGMAKRMEVSSKINDELYDMMIQYRARRALVIEFHNSKENLNGLPFAWYDATHETTQPNVVKVQQRCQNIAIGQVMTIINDLRENDGYLVYDSERIISMSARNSMLYIWLIEENNQINNVVYIGIYNQQDVMIGVITLEYTEKYPIENALLDKSDILKRVERISTYLEFK